MTLTVTVTATVTQDGTRSTADVDDDEWPAELRWSPLATRSAEDPRCALPQEGSRGQERSEDDFDIEAECRTRAFGSVADGAAALGGALSHRVDVGIEKTLDTDPEAAWIFVAAQLDTHRSAKLVEWVARRCGVAQDLGVKGNNGILKSKQTRKKFLEDASHRIRFVYTPRHCSWLNQVESWFSILDLADRVSAMLTKRIRSV